MMTVSDMSPSCLQPEKPPCTPPCAALDTVVLRVTPTVDSVELESHPAIIHFDGDGKNNSETTFNLRTTVVVSSLTLAVFC